MSIRHEITKILVKYKEKIEVKECAACGKIKLNSDVVNFDSLEISDIWIDYKLPPWVKSNETYCYRCFEKYAQNYGNWEDIINNLNEKGIKSVYVGDREVPVRFLKFYSSFKFFDL